MPRAVTCNDCYFRRKGLCALEREETCPTFRHMHRGRMATPRQAQLLEPTSARRHPVPVAIGSAR